MGGQFYCEMSSDTQIWNWLFHVEYSDELCDGMVLIIIDLQKVSNFNSQRILLTHLN